MRTKDPKSTWPFDGPVTTGRLGFNVAHSSPLSRQLLPRLSVRIEHRKVADDDGNRKSDGQHTGDGAQSADHHSGIGSWHHVAIADGLVEIKESAVFGHGRADELTVIVLKAHHRPSGMDLKSLCGFF